MIKLSFAKLFPQITRFFSALILWLCLLILLGVNLIGLSKVSSEYVLGVFSDYQEQLAQAQLERKQIQNQYRFWQEVVRQKPDYRDAYLTLASLAYQLGLTSEAETYLSQANQLDPTNITTRQLKEIVP